MNKVYFHSQIFYVARNPKDVAVSYYHHYCNIEGYEGTQEDFTEAFLYEKLMYAPFIDHVLDFWNLRDEPNVLFLFYEDMKRNLDQVVKKAIKFLGKNYTQTQIDELCNHLSIDSMRANPSCNNDLLVAKAKTLNKKPTMNGNYRFIRKGEVGSFKEEFTKETDMKFESFMQNPSLHRNEFKFRT
jgi:hypothetical protein